VSKTAPKRLRDKFLDWQCNIRQAAMRVDDGRPSPGMRPRLLDAGGEELAPALTVLLVPKAPKNCTAFFRFQVMKSADPRETYEKTLRFLQADYYQDSNAFNDRLLATLAPDAPFADALMSVKRCVLDFAEGRLAYRLPCKVKALKHGNADRDAAIWHNRVFNPALPDSVHVLAFDPDWASAQTTSGRETSQSNPH
jgi:hypothetical protein